MLGTELSLKLMPNWLFPGKLGLGELIALMVLFPEVIVVPSINTVYPLTAFVPPANCEVPVLALLVDKLPKSILSPDAVEQLVATVTPTHICKKGGTSAPMLSGEFVA